MKRGIIRIISGIVMIILQILSIIGRSSVESTVSTDIWTNMGFYSVGITGIILLVYGVHAYNNGFHSQLVLHSRTKKVHTVTKWILFSIAALLFVYYVLSFISSWSSFNVFTILMIFATLSFALYLLLYVYKKPSCLFSAALIFTGVAYLYGLISNRTYYMLYLSAMDNYVLYVALGIIPRLLTGILYIIIATRLYKEKFSAKVVKVFGWIAFGLEFTSRALCDIIVFYNFSFYNLSNLFFLFITGLFLYISVFNMNTLQQVKKEDKASTAVEAISRKAETMVSDTQNTIFCRKCGAKILSDSAFCDSCGGKIERA